MATISLQLNAQQALSLITALNQQYHNLTVNLNQVTAAAAKQVGFMEQLSRQYQVITQSRIFFTISAGLQSAADEAQKLARQVTEIQTISQDLGLSSATWTKNIIELSNKLGTSATDIAAGTYQTLSNSISGARTNTQAFVETAGQFAQVTQTTTKNAVDLLSSAINSYGLSAVDATKVSVVLFGTIERGRIRAEAIANTFGRVAVGASQLGVSLEETSAAITALSVKGLKESEVITQLNSIFTGLLAPSQALQKAFEEMGFASPAAALRTEGLVKTLQRLKTIIRGLPEEAAKAFTNIRGQRGILGLTPEDVDREIKAISDPQKYKNAVAEVTNSVSNQLDRAKEEFKNTFISIGTDVGVMSAKFIKAFKAMGLSVTELTTAMTVLVSGGAVLTAIAGLQRLGIIAGASGAAGAIHTLSNAITFLGTQLPIVAGFSAGFGAGLVIFKQSADEITKIENKAKAAAAVIREIERERKAAGTAPQARESAPTFQAASLRVLGEQSRQYQREIAKMGPRISDAMNVARAAIDATAATAKDAVKTIEREINDSFTNIAKNSKSFADFQIGLRHDLIEFQKEFASPEQFQTLLQNQIAEQKSISQKLIAESTQLTGARAAEKLAESNAALREAAKAARELESIRARERGGVVQTTNLEYEQQQLTAIKLRNMEVFEQGQKKQIENENIKLTTAKTTENLREREAVEANKILSKLGEQVINLERIRELQEKGAFKVPTAVFAELELINNMVKVEEKRTQEKKKQEEATKQIGELEKEIARLKGEISAGPETADAQNNLRIAKESLETLRATGAVGGKGLSAYALQLELINNALASISKGDNAKALEFLQTGLGDRPQAGAVVAATSNEIVLARDALATMQKRFQDLSEAQAKLNKLNDTGKGELVKLAGSLTNAYAAMSADASAYDATMVPVLEKTGKLASDLQKAADASKQIVIPLHEASPTPGQAAGGRAFGMAAGGIGFGPDSFPAMLRSGEGVFDARTMQLFGRQMSEFATSARTSSNVTNGDVNIYLQGTGSNFTEKDVRTLVNAINRERRRGTI